MLSRAAENIFWMSRYIERTNFQLRALQTRYVAYQNEASAETWENFCEEYHIVSENGAMSIGDMLAKAVFDTDNHASIAHHVFRARENARSAQDHITKEVWQCLNDFHHLIRDRSLIRDIQYGDPIRSLDLLIQQVMIYSGVVDNSMPRNESYRFLESGKFIERILSCITILRKQWILYGEDQVENDYSHWRYFLTSMSGYEFYLRTNLGTMEKEKIFHQMIYEPLFPNSIIYSLQQIKTQSKSLEQGGSDEINSAVALCIGKAIAQVRFTNYPKSTDDKMQFLANVEQDIFDIVHVFNQSYFGLVV